MNVFYKSGRVENKPKEPIHLPDIDLTRANHPAGYIPDEGLADAVNVALTLRQPLLVTGEPGTGKTTLAWSIAWRLGLDEPDVFETKSTSVARDLFYSYDSLARFRAAQTGQSIDERIFLKLNALGNAILRANPPQKYRDQLGSDIDSSGPKQSVVLIDEIDKAPRDFPNDILNEIEKFYFRIPELGDIQIKAPPELRPIVIITSNLEKGLPDPFLRRCIFYNIPFPTQDRLEQIVLSRIPYVVGEGGKSVFLREALDFFDQARRKVSNLIKPPGTAELLNWLMALLSRGLEPEKGLREQSGIASRQLSALAKIGEDQGKIIEVFKSWVYEGEGKESK